MKFIKLKDPDTKKCNHNPQSKNSTLKFINFETLDYPPKFRAVCPCCGECFEFIKNKNEKYIEVKEEQ